MGKDEAPGRQEPRVVIWMHPYRRSVTIEVMSAHETVVDRGQFDTDRHGFELLIVSAEQWAEWVWAIKGCNGIGRHIATRLIERGENALDVPPKLSARVGVFSTGQGRKTDATDEHSIALVGVRIAGLVPVVRDEQLEVLRL